MEQDANLSRRVALRDRALRDLNAERQITQLAKNLASKLNEEIAKGDDVVAFMIALLLAAFKDFLDIVLDFFGVGLIPGVSFSFGLFLTSFLFFFMYGKGYFLKWRLQFWFWVLGLGVDNLPAFNALPINTLLVLYAWRLARKRAAKGKQKLENLNNLTEHELKALDDDISLLEASDEDIKAITRYSSTARQAIDTGKNVKNRYREDRRRFNTFVTDKKNKFSNATNWEKQKKNIKTRIGSGMVSALKQNYLKGQSDNFHSKNSEGPEKTKTNRNN